MRKEKGFSALREQLTKALTKIASDSFFGKEPILTLNKLLEIKSALAPINGVITQAVAMEFIREIHRAGILPNNIEDILETLMESSPYSNGYDIHINAVEDRKTQLVAEVKVNEPVEITEFGAAQTKSLIKDIAGLLSPINKKKRKEIIGDDYLRFMVLLEGNDKKNFSAAVGSLIAEAQKKGFNVELYQRNTQLRHDTIYVYIVARDFVM